MEKEKRNLKKFMNLLKVHEFNKNEKWKKTKINNEKKEKIKNKKEREIREWKENEKSTKPVLWKKNQKKNS